MTTDVRLVDSAYPIHTLEGCDGRAFYAGGDTPHVWTLAEVTENNPRYLVPIWVRSNPQQVDPLADGNAFVNVLKTVYHAPTGILVALDSETSIDPVFVVAFVATLNAAGYKVIDYASQSDLFGNKNPDGYYWGADWTGTEHIVTGDQATQYVSFPQYDLSEFNSSLPLWDTQPQPQPKAKVIDMIIVRRTLPDKQVVTYLFNGFILRHVMSVQDEAAFVAAGLPVVDVSEAQFSELAGE